MALFVGGPFDGDDLPYDPKTSPHIRMPDVEPKTGVSGDKATVRGSRPHIYEADLHVDPPVFRFVRTEQE